MDRPGGLAAIGNTPVVRLERLADDSCAEVWVKLEAANPTGSYKDRVALALIEAAYAERRLRPWQPVAAYHGGSTSSSPRRGFAGKGHTVSSAVAALSPRPLLPSDSRPGNPGV